MEKQDTLIGEDVQVSAAAEVSGYVPPALQDLGRWETVTGSPG